MTKTPKCTAILTPKYNAKDRTPLVSGYGAKFKDKILTALKKGEPFKWEEWVKASQKTALYRHYDKDGTLLYIGISLSQFTRLKQHQKSIADWTDMAVTMTTEWLPTRREAFKAEKQAIKLEKPLCNILHNNTKRQ